MEKDTSNNYLEFAPFFEYVHHKSFLEVCSLNLF